MVKMMNFNWKIMNFMIFCGFYIFIEKGFALKKNVFILCFMMRFFG